MTLEKVLENVIKKVLLTIAINSMRSAIHREEELETSCNILDIVVVTNKEYHESIEIAYHYEDVATACFDRL